ncbi:MAG: L-aspartate oxidase [Actinobacteria bacterium]|nr:L-aspartate oxidase [Actinomycetota bacterium]MCB9411345.1 L-aspartate oxidase [Actinomycetota bacterium]
MTGVPRLPTSLVAPTPGWTRSADVIVVGSGIAGLAVAMHARRAGLSVLVVTKSYVTAGSTAWAQGGIAAALADDDSPAAHRKDTLVAGAGLCDVAAVDVLVNDGPRAINDLLAWGTQFDRDSAGGLALTREGGHHRRRIAHAGGDATGAEIVRAMVAEVAENPGITVIEHALALDLLTDVRGNVQGLTLHVIGEGQQDGVGAVLAPAVVLATGGIGQVFSASTNPTVATGDGVALGLRGGAIAADMEFIQFHPTVLWLGGEAVGQQPLVSEAVRGEGAYLVDDDGVRFMLDEHPLAELAPRDVVAKAIMRRMRATGSEHVWLDGRHLSEDMWTHRFPTILASTRTHGIDPVTDLVPVGPAQHYTSGGLRTDTWGRTNVGGLFACGECSCTGVHGANRLASNSLLEGLVFADRIGQLLASGLPERAEPVEKPTAAGLTDPAARTELQRAMTDGVSVLRSEQSIGEAQRRLAALPQGDEPGTPAWETTNLLTVASTIATGAQLRCETRGSHWREDFHDRDDDHWRRRILTRLRPDGTLAVDYEPLATMAAEQGQVNV